MVCAPHSNEVQVEHQAAQGGRAQGGVVFLATVCAVLGCEALGLAGSEARPSVSTASGAQCMSSGSYLPRISHSKVLYGLHGLVASWSTACITTLLSSNCGAGLVQLPQPAMSSTLTPSLGAPSSTQRRSRKACSDLALRKIFIYYSGGGEFMSACFALAPAWRPFTPP